MQRIYTVSDYTAYIYILNWTWNSLHVAREVNMKLTIIVTYVRAITNHTRHVYILMRGSL